MGTDWGALYADNVAAVTALAEDLDRDPGSDRPAVRVAATPEWTVRQVLAHLAGGPSDGVAGRMDGAPGRSWTARHVSEREGLTVAELVAEMRGNVAPVAALVDGNPRPAIVWDVAVHHADLHEGLGLGRMDDALWRPVLDAVAPGMLAAAPVTLRVGDATYGAGGDEASVSPYELFRSLFSRRSRSQMAAWGSPAMTSGQLDELCIFGPRDDDQPVPEG
ncbi:hypothetical protein [Nocardioides taihuensis]|uniref:Maleylpyruvate isomerase family mycothiol-dependent enzyme n=1 Tax=Nocardioides taihuensis TaxID=1835606 RepID=A0ABW0BGM5_9ACTN